MKVTLIPIVSDALEVILKGLVKRLGELDTRGLMETIQTTHIYQSLHSGKIWHKVNFFKRSLTGFEFRVFLLLD